MTVRTAVLIAMLAAAPPIAAFAQVPPVAVGEKVMVTNAEGFEFRGDVTAISSTAVEVLTAAGPKRLPMSEVWMITKKDSNRQGFLIGAGVGLIAGLSTGSDEVMRDQQAGFVAVGMLLYGGIGALIDNAIAGREMVYHRPEKTATAVINITPIVGLDGPRRLGVGGTITWK